MHAHDKSGASGILLGIAALALAGMVGTVSLIRDLPEAGPRVGDIIAFDPMRQLPQDMRARIAAFPASDEPIAACVLDIRAMHAKGGSVVIEAKQPGAARPYQAHWAGDRTSTTAAGCDGNTDLLLTLDDIETMAMAAGGYGVANRSMAARSLWNSATAAQ